MYGRLPVYIVTVFLSTIFDIACALAPSPAALIVLRFFAGLVSSAPLSNAGGTLNDIITPVSRTLLLPIITTFGFVGPMLAPLIGGFVATNPSYGWRWVYWIVVLWNGVAFLVVVFFMPETLAPALLKMKAKRLRKVTGDKRWRAQVEDERLKLATIKALKRPFAMLAVEPALQFFVLYLLGMSTALSFSLFRPFPFI